MSDVIRSLHPVSSTIADRVDVFRRLLIPLWVVSGCIRDGFSVDIVATNVEINKTLVGSSPLLSQYYSGPQNEVRYCNSANHQCEENECCCTHEFIL